MGPIIGILDLLNINSSTRPSSNYYKINELYVRRLTEAGASCIGIITLSDDVLNMCDGFLIQGGTRINREYYIVIDYAIKHNKPLLGICAGMQALVLYDVLRNECILSGNSNPTPDDIYAMYVDDKRNGKRILSRVSGHCSMEVSSPEPSSLDDIVESTHNVTFTDDSILKEIYGTNNINVISLHKYGYKDELSLFKITGRSDDGVIEAVEYNKILGVQFHVEIKRNDPVIKKFVEYIKEDANH